MGSKNDVNKVTIIGQGPAGLTAAIYAARANLEPVVISGNSPGGQLMITTEVENYPGFKDGIMGPDLMDEMLHQALRFGTRVINSAVTSVDFSAQPYSLILDTGEKIASHSVIISTGATAKLLELDSESKLMGHGVSACATCDGFFFREREVIVVGGGDTAMEEALYLSKLCSKVSVVHRRDRLRASRIMQERALKNQKIAFVWNSVVDEIHDVDKGLVTGVTLKNTQTGEKSFLAADGVFIAIGHQPNTGMFRGVLDMDEVGYLLVDGVKTKYPGVYAAGDVADKTYRQAVTAAGAGCQAAIEAERWLAEQGIE